jgi:hypothetical protein
MTHSGSASHAAYVLQQLRSSHFPQLVGSVDGPQVCITTSDGGVAAGGGVHVEQAAGPDVSRHPSYAARARVAVALSPGGHAARHVASISPFAEVPHRSAHAECAAQLGSASHVCRCGPQLVITQVPHAVDDHALPFVASPPASAPASTVAIAAVLEEHAAASATSGAASNSAPPMPSHDVRMARVSM